ncbi:hypothetical protein [Candidatus Chlorohelix sp.]|uniref:hypothetical protein n=1 Tax=Candidatus Chlorohelix sp. TaxID=3139201 RepID=UPI003067A3C8
MIDERWAVMARGRTNNINDYIDDYEAASRDYAEMGPLWAEMYFPDDFETLKVIMGGRDNNAETAFSQSQNSGKIVGVKN